MYATHPFHFPKQPFLLVFHEWCCTCSTVSLVVCTSRKSNGCKGWGLVGRGLCRASGLKWGVGPWSGGVTTQTSSSRLDTRMTLLPAWVWRGMPSLAAPKEPGLAIPKPAMGTPPETKNSPVSLRSDIPIHLPPENLCFSVVCSITAKLHSMNRVRFSKAPST